MFQIRGTIFRTVAAKAGGQGGQLHPKVMERGASKICRGGRKLKGAAAIKLSSATPQLIKALVTRRG